MTHEKPTFMHERDIATVKGLVLIAVAPVGRETSFVFGQRSDGSAFYDWEHDVYPRSLQADALRGLRVSLGLGLRAGAARLGLSVVRLGELERGHWTCDWALAARLLRGEP